MTETSNGDVFIRNPTTTITTGLTTFFEIFAGFIQDDKIKEGAIALTPIFVLGIVIILKNLKKEYEFKKGKKYYNEMISELKTEAQAQGCTSRRKNEIAEQLVQHQKNLDKLRENNIKIIIT